MIYVYLYGRLGNNLSQLAAAATLAQQHSTDFAALPISSYWCPEPDNCYLNDYLVPFKETIFRKINFINSLPQNTREINEDENLNKICIQNDDIVLNGYFLNEKYIDKSVIQNLFEIDQKTYSYIQNKYSFLFSEQFCSITVRRGDYLKIPEQYAVCVRTYYNKAIKKLRDKQYAGKFLIISDDIEWCYKTFKGDAFYFVENEEPLIDLYLQTFCEHNILSNSTFACWGALLNKNTNKKVIIPDPWYGISYRKKNETMLLALPTNWIRVKNQSIYYRIKGLYIYIKEALLKRIKG